MNKPEIQESQIIMIDEGQFFNDIVECVDQLANQGKTVIIAALNGNYLREEFPVISRLIPKVENIINLKAVCSLCGEDAYFTQRIVQSDSIELIGGAESYQPRCRKCFHT